MEYLGIAEFEYVPTPKTASLTDKLAEVQRARHCNLQGYDGHSDEATQMARTCSICADPNRDEIDRLGRLGDSIAKIAQEFALSYDALMKNQIAKLNEIANSKQIAEQAITKL